jgi:hypothetical protein
LFRLSSRDIQAALDYLDQHHDDVPDGSEYPIEATQGGAQSGIRPHAWPTCSALPLLVDLPAECDDRVNPLPCHFRKGCMIMH